MKRFLQRFFAAKQVPAPLTVDAVHVRPLLRKGDLERITETHRELEAALQGVRAEATRVASVLTSELETSRRKVATIAESLIDPLIMVNYHGEIMTVNHSAEEIFGYSRRQLVGRSIDTILGTGEKYEQMLLHESQQYIAFMADKRDRCDTTDSYHEVYKQHYLAKSCVLNVIHEHQCRRHGAGMIHAQFMLNVLSLEATTVENMVYVVSVNDITNEVKTLNKAESLAQFQLSALTAIPNPMFYMDSKLQVLGCNSPFTDMVQLPDNGIKSKKFNDIFDLPTAKVLFDIARGLISKDSPDVQIHHMSIRTKYGVECKDMAAYFTALRSKDGVFTGLLGLFINMHDIMSMRRFQDTLLESIPNPVFYLDADMMYINCNSAYERLTGVSRDQIIGRSRTQFLTGGAPTRDAQDLTRMLLEKDFELHSGVVRTQQYQSYVIQETTGKRIDLLEYRTAIVTDSGKFDGVLGVLTDISPVCKAGGRSQGLLIEAIPFPVALHGRDCVFIDCNQAFCDMVGIDRADVLGKLCSHEPFVRYEPSVGVPDSMSSPSVRSFDLELYDNKSHSTRLFTVYKSPVANCEGAFIGIINIYLDLTLFNPIRSTK